MLNADTIIAPATLIGASGLSVFRISGEKALFCLQKMIGEEKIKKLERRPRTTLLAALYNPTTKQKFDEALITYFPAPHSFTGEDVIEISCHGGLAVAKLCQKAALSVEGMRLAEPGEFTRRAFENGKVDLTQAEAIGDLIHAETEAQAQLALHQLEGGLRDLYEAWGERLKKAMAFIEADLDFSDEDVPDALSQSMRPLLETLISEIKAHLDDKNLGERLRSGFRVAVIGAPNAGKSSLINALAKRDIAIVTDQAGTTRDILETHLNLGGFPVIVADMAGLRATEEEIEREGIRRAKEWAGQADLKLALFVVGQEPDQETLSLIDENTLIFLSHSDTIKDEALKVPQRLSAYAVSPLSIYRQETLTHLIQQVSKLLKQKSGLEQVSGENVSRETVPFFTRPLITKERHRAALMDALTHLERSLMAPELDMMAEDVRLAVRSLGKITGRIDVEDLLDVIFNEFCIGK